MINKTLRSFAVFFIILGVSFSNIPFYALTGLIDSYEKTSGVVDKLWLVQQNHDSDVVDNFSSLRNISEKLRVMEAMAAAPTFVNKGAFASGTAALTVGVPAAYQDNDVFLLFVESANEVIATPAGWTQVTNSPQGTGTAAAIGGVRLGVFYKIVTGAQSSVTVADTGNHTTAIIMGFRGVDTAAPVNISAGAVSAATTAMSLPTVTTTVVDTFVVLAAAMDTDLASTATVTGWANASLTGITEQHDQTVISGVGGGLAIATGVKATAGATGATTATGSTSVTHAYLTIALKPALPVVTISNFVSSEPGNSTIAPNASGAVDSFGLVTNTSTDTVTAATVGLAAGMGQYIQTVAITNDGDTVTYCSATPSGDSASLSSCGIPVSTTNTQFKIKLTAKAHASMPAPDGGAYAVTATITAFTSTNGQLGTDSGSSTLTIDNDSPAATTGAGATSGENGQSVVNWTPPGDGDLENIYIYCKTSSMTSGEAPVEGDSPTAGSTCDGTVRLRYVGGASPQTFTGLTNGTTYYFRIYARDTNGNFTAYSATQQVTGTPSAPSNTLTISQTAGSKVATKNSGDVNQYAHDTACTGAGTCSAFTLASTGGTTNVTSIKITESGTVTANTELSDLNLYYDYDGNWADAGAETLFGTVANFAGDQTATVSGTLAINDGQTAYIYARYDLANGAVYPTGGATVNFQIAASSDVVSDATESGTGALVGTQTVRPNVTDVTDSALVDGGRNGETFTITGMGFGTLCASVLVQVEGTTLTCNNTNNTTISATIPSTQTTTYGGASSMLVTVGGTADDASQTYYVYPNVTVPPTNDSGREASDVTVQGTRFGATQGTVQFTGAFDNPSPINASITSWSDTSITVTVPASITDSTYLGDIKIIRNSDSKTDLVYDTNGFRVLPRITGLVPSNGIVDASVTVNGDHLCQSGTCPGSFSAANKVTFNSGVVATTFTSWSDTVIETAVPTGAITGDVVVTSNTTYTSNALTFTVNANTTTLATGSDPAVNTIAPGASATDVDLFTLQTNGGTESVTSVTVNLSTNSGIGLLAITDNANTVLGSTASPVTGSNVISVAGMSAGTGVTTFKVRVTPLSHAAMSAPAGASYAITAPVTAWAGGNTHAGSDTNTNVLTIDNTSPAGTTGATPTAGDAQVQLSWSNPGDGDFQKVIIYCKTSSITETPTEGSDPSVDGTACDTTARVKYSGSVSPQTITGLSNGTLYYFRIYARDTNGNFTAIASTEQVSATPTLTQTLTVGTVGTQATNLNSGSTAQHIGGAGTAAFTLQINTGSSNVTSVKVSETGTVAMANLANPKLYYENAVNAASCAYGGAESFVSGAAPVGETVTFTLPSVAVGLTANVTCLYFVSDVTSSAVGGQTIELQITNPSTDVVVSSGVNDDTEAKAIGTTTIRPNVTDATNSPLGDGGRNGETFTITGAGFGTACGSLSVAVGGLTLTCNSATNTEISATIPSTQTTTYGGASSMLVTVGGTADDASQTYYVYPNVTVPPTNDSGREASDVTVQGTRFGATQGTVQFTGAFDNPSPINASITSWSDTSITVTVPASITDTTYLGDIKVIRNSDSKTDLVYDTNGFRVLPRITSLNPSSASVNDPIVVNGDHLCQSGSCPGSFSATNKVTFFSGVDATYWGAGGWTNTAIDTKVPAGATTGDVVVTSDTSYTSNSFTFTLSSATPNDPTDLGQFKNSGLTQPIAIGGVASSTPAYLSMTMQAALSGGTLYPQIEYKPIGTPFTCTGSGACASAMEGTGVAGPGPVTGSVSVTPTDDIYHWQARVCHNKNGTHTASCGGTGDYPSALWVSFGGNGEGATDFLIDTTPPAVSSVSSGTPGTNSATIAWSTASEISSSQVQWNTTGTFVANCATNNDCTAITDISPMVNPHGVTLSNLNSGTTYHYRVRSKDAAGNETIDPPTGDYTFATQAVASPAKTTRFHIVGKTSEVTNGSPLEQTFSVFMPELATSTKSAFVEIVGVYSATAASPSVDVRVNGETLKTYTLPYNSNPTKSYFKILHKVNAVTVETANANTLYVTPDTNTTIYINSADINVNYSYTP